MATISSRAIFLLCEFALVGGLAPALAKDVSYQSRPLTPPGEYTFNIEGPAVDAQGNLYVVNFARPGTIGRLAPGAAHSELFATLPDGSVGNAIRFDADGRMFVADYKQHNIFLVSADGGAVTTYFHADAFNQPNDLTLAADGTIYASDPNWKKRDGQVWRIARAADGTVQGERMTTGRRMGTTNGIDLSPDGSTLYVGESDSREIWAYRIYGTHLLAPRLVTRFADFDIDGLRTDMAGNLWVARILKGSIAVLTPGGKLLRDIPLGAAEPTNLAFGGPDGRTVYVTQRKGGFVESFRSDVPGREFCLRGCSR